MSTHQARHDYFRQSADLSKKYLDFSMAFRMDKTLAVLIDIRASQMDGCAFWQAWNWSPASRARPSSRRNWAYPGFWRGPAIKTS